MEKGINEEELKKSFYEFRLQAKEYLLIVQRDKRTLSKDNKELADQMAMVYQRISILLDLYEQMVVEDRTFNESYLEYFLGTNFKNH